MSTKERREQLETVRELLRSLIAEGRVEEAIEVAMTMVMRLQSQNTELVLRLEALRRERAGRRSERVDPGQLLLLMELCGEGEEEGEKDVEATKAEDAALDAEIAEAEGEMPASPRRQPRRGRPSRNLPREIIRHELPAEERQCGGCGEVMPQIGEDVSELVELVPAQFIVHEHHRAKYACPRCKETVQTAPGPVKLVEKGLAGPGLLAHVVVSKYQDHVPLTRLQTIYARGGLEVGRSTLCGWVGAVAEEIRPIVDRIWEMILASRELQADGSGLKVLARDDPMGVRRGTMWSYVGDRRWVVFRFAPTGSGEDGPWTHLAGRDGYLQADAATVFDRLYDGQQATATEVGCWGHARRKYHDLKDNEPRTAYPLKLIAQLYRVETLADRRGLTPPERQRLRMERSSRILDRLKRYVVKMKARENPESAFAKACGYTLNQWEALTRFLQDGALPLDNNLCELQLRSLAVGRRNYLFAGSDAGAQNAATTYSLLRTCALHGVDPFAYLKDVLGKLAAGWPQSRIDDLLPGNWIPATPIPTPELQPAS